MGWSGGKVPRYVTLVRYQAVEADQVQGSDQATCRRRRGAGTNDSNSDDDNGTATATATATPRYGKEQGAHAEVRGEKWAAAPHLVSAGASWTAREQLTTALPFPSTISTPDSLDTGILVKDRRVNRGQPDGAAPRNQDRPGTRRPAVKHGRDFAVRKRPRPRSQEPWRSQNVKPAQRELCAVSYLR